MSSIILIVIFIYVYVFLQNIGGDQANIDVVSVFIKFKNSLNRLYFVVLSVIFFKKLRKSYGKICTFSTICIW